VLYISFFHEGSPLVVRRILQLVSYHGVAWLESVVVSLVRKSDEFTDPHPRETRICLERPGPSYVGQSEALRALIFFIVCFRCGLQALLVLQFPALSVF